MVRDRQGEDKAWVPPPGARARDHGEKGAADPVISGIHRGQALVVKTYGRRLIMANRIRPLNDRIIVKGIEAEQKTASGIIIPDTAKEKPQEGRVIAVGEGRREDGKRIPVDVKRGDRVLYGKYAGTEIKIEGEDHLILREDDVLGVVES